MALAQIEKSNSEQSFVSSSLVFTVKQNWTVDPETQNDVLAGLLSVSGDFQAKSIRWIQVARIQKEDDSEFKWESSLTPRNEMRSANGYFVDYDAALCKKGTSCSPYFKDSWANEEFASEQTGLSQMADFPFGWSEFKRISLEACAVETADEHILGCVKWGAEWPATTDRVLAEIQFNKEASQDFLEAFKKFKDYYSSK